MAQPHGHGSLSLVLGTHIKEQVSHRDSLSQASFKRAARKWRSVLHNPTLDVLVSFGCCSKYPENKKLGGEEGLFDLQFQVTLSLSGHQGRNLAGRITCRVEGGRREMHASGRVFCSWLAFSSYRGMCCPRSDQLFLYQLTSRTAPQTCPQPDLDNSSLTPSFQGF